MLKTLRQALVESVENAFTMLRCVSQDLKRKLPQRELSKEEIREMAADIEMARNFCQEALEKIATYNSETDTTGWPGD